MGKRILVVCLAFVMLLGIAATVSAQGCEADSPCCKELGTYCVTYHENNCLNAVPVDQKGYKYGDTVKVLFEPVLYKNGLYFYGWSHTPFGYANYGYNYDTFKMPAQNVDLYAVCIAPWWVWQEIGDPTIGPDGGQDDTGSESLPH